MGILLTLVGGLVLTTGDILMKKWVVINNYYFFSSGLFIYLIGLCFLAFSFRYENIAVASILLVLFNVISLSLVSYFYFGEKLNLVQIFAIILGLVAVVILEYGGK